MPATVDLSIADVDFTDPDVNRNPYGELRRLRDTAPAVFNRPSNTWMVASFEHARRVIGDDTCFATTGDLLAQMFGGEVFEGLDNPRHKELRDIWQPAMGRISVQGWTEAISQLVDDTFASAIARLKAGETVDLQEYNRRIPAYVIASMLGIPVEDYELFNDWGLKMASTLEAQAASTSPRAEALLREGVAATRALCDYAGEHLQRRRESGATDDLLGMLANTSVPMTRVEQEATVTQLVFAGHETTTKLMGMTMMALAMHPEQRRLIAEDRSLIPQAIEEVLRWSGPIGTAPRRVRTSGVEIGGVPVAEGDLIFTMFAGANRDPERWENSESFDIFRPTLSHLTFAFGIHNCLGSSLARLEVRIWLDKLLEIMPEYELVGGVDDLYFGRNMFTRGPTALPVAL
jgi:cytochrome P450